VHRFKLLMALVTVFGAARAAQPIASITSASSFELRGHTVNVDGVPTWPIAPGDDVATGADSATVQLRDGSRVVLLQGSRLRVDFKDNTVQLLLLSGSLRMGSVIGPKVAVYSQGSLVKPVSGSIVTAGPSGASRQGAESHRSLSLPIPISHH
jgi:hypothetical protein